MPTGRLRTLNPTLYLFGRRSPRPWSLDCPPYTTSTPMHSLFYLLVLLSCSVMRTSVSPDFPWAFASWSVFSLHLSPLMMYFVLRNASAEDEGQHRPIRLTRLTWLGYVHRGGTSVTLRAYLVWVRGCLHCFKGSVSGVLRWSGPCPPRSASLSARLARSLGPEHFNVVFNPAPNAAVDERVYPRLANKMSHLINLGAWFLASPFFLLRNI